MIPCARQSFDTHSKGQANLQDMWHEEGPKQHDVVAAVSLTDSVPLLSQGSPVVVVAAGAADVSNVIGPPRHQHECHDARTAELKEVDPSMSLSAADAASLSSYNGIHL